MSSKMSGRKEKTKYRKNKQNKQNKHSAKLWGLLLILGLLVGVSVIAAYADGGGEVRNLQNGSFEEGQTWTDTYKQMNQGLVPSWNTTAFDGQKIELLRENTGTYISGVKVKPSDGNYAAELNADEESTLYQYVKTSPASIYKWGLDHGARNGTDTMALVIGPKQSVDPSKPDKNGRDQLMQMIDWLIAQGQTSVKTSAGLGERLTVYSKKFATAGAFENNSDGKPFSLTPSSVYTEEWKIWIMASSRATSGTNSWNYYGSNGDGSGGTGIDLSKYYLYQVPSGQTDTLFGFVSVGVKDSVASAGKEKTYGNFLDGINFELYHPLSGSTTLHGSAVIGDSGGGSLGGGGGTGYQVTIDNELATYVTDGEALKIQAIVKHSDAAAGCEFVGVYYTKQEGGSLVTKFLERIGHEIEDTGSLTSEQKREKWVKSTNAAGDIIYTYDLTGVTSATDLHFIFIKNPTITYDPNGGKPYVVERSYNTEEAANVYSYKPAAGVPDAEAGTSFTFIPPYVSHAAEGQNEGWKFMGWLLTGDAAGSSGAYTPVNADKLGSLLLPAVHTVACDYELKDISDPSTAQFFDIWNGNQTLNRSIQRESDIVKGVVWTGSEAKAYANMHKGLTLVAQWRWRQAFIPQTWTGSAYTESVTGGTVAITSVSNPSDENYNSAFNGNGGKSYHAAANEIVTVKATANAGYSFTGWYDEGGNQLSTNSTYSYIATKESVKTFYARFSSIATQTYIRQIKNGSSWDNTTDDSIGTLTNYSYTGAVGTSAGSTATAKSGYKFLGWYDASGNPVSADKLTADGAAISYTITGDATYYARFASATIPVTQTFIRQVKNGSDWVSTTDDNVGTLTSYGHTGTIGTVVNSSASEGTNYKFEGWFDEHGNRVVDSMLRDGGKTIRYTTTGDATYFARFSPAVTQTFIRQIGTGGSWATTTDDSIGVLSAYTHKDTVGAAASSKATVGAGYKFVGWYDSPSSTGNKVSDDATYSYTTTGNATYYARFSPTVTQTFIRQIEIGGSWVTTTNDSVGVLSRYMQEDTVGTTASSTATEGTDYKFVGWYDSLGNSVTDDVTLSYTTTGNATYYARFSPAVTQTFIRQVKTGASWSTTLDDGVGVLSAYTHKDTVGAAATSKATVGAGYRFEGWYDEHGNSVSDSMLSDGGKTISYTTTGNAAYYARFSKILVNQTFIRQIENGGSWTNTADDGIAILSAYVHSGEPGAAASSTATAKPGYQFEGWYDSMGNRVTDAVTLSYTTIGDATYYARFSRIVPAGPGGVDPGTGSGGTDPGTGDPGTGDPGTGDPGTEDPGTGGDDPAADVTEPETEDNPSEWGNSDHSEKTPHAEGLLPQTGDSTGILIWIVLLAASICGLAALLLTGKHQANDDRQKAKRF